MEIAAFAAGGVLAVLILMFVVSRLGRRSDVYGDVMAFEQARRALGRDVPPDATMRPAVELHHRRSA